MKLTYRDKIIASVLIVIAILGIGFFGFIKPKRADIESHEKTLKQVQEQEAAIRKKIAEIEPLKKEITDTYNNTGVITDNFVPVEDVDDPVIIDKYMQKFADNNKVKIKSLQLNSTTMTPIEYYYDKDKDTFAEIRKAADVSGNLQKQYDLENAEGTALDQRTKESIMKTQYGVIVEGTKYNIWKYIKDLKEFDKAIMVNSLNFSDYTFGEKAAKENNVALPESHEGEEVSVQAGDKTITNKSEATFVITLYSVYEMEKPEVDTVPN